jgi:hypothetical protein
MEKQKLLKEGTSCKMDFTLIRMMIIKIMQSYQILQDACLYNIHGSPFSE